MSLLHENINRIKTLMNINEGEASFPSDEKQHLERFVDFVKKELGLENDINIRYQTDKDGIKTTAVYKYQDGDEDHEQSEVRVYTKERALQDIMRSVAHELVHHQQNENGKLKGKISNVGGPIEDEANAVAGELLKKYGINHPEIYGDEEEVNMEFTEEEGDGGGGDTGGATTDTSGDSSSTNANVSTWETGLTRGPANQLTITVWSSDVARGKANPIDQNSKWESGVNRGKANRVI